MSDKIPVVIDLTSTVENGSEEETTHNQVKGDLLSKGQATYIRYNEQTEDEESVRNVVKITEEEMVILRNGPVSMNQRFREGQTTEGHYGTQFGNMHMETATERMAFTREPDQGTGEIVLEYQLKLQGNELGRVTLTFTFREVGQ
ncbi:MAG TPA: DUF1934 domain-containing protein [Bacillales bacterium]|nr:DUF1934 domain-containing protein [Bacillales bacterium]